MYIIMKPLLLSLVFVAHTICAQDVIVKKDGSTILSKVLEVNTDNIKYKRFSNQKGPTYTVNIADIMAINYDSGDKDVFIDAVKPAPSEKVASFLGVNPNLAEYNLKLVREYNNRKAEYIGSKGDKSCVGYQIVLRMEEGSIIETPELRTDFYTENGKNFIVSLYNKTNKTIYIDLSDCYFIECDNARPLYVPSSTSTGKSSTTGGSVNLGAIAGAAGIGGAIGTIAGGVSVGGANTNTNTTTVYSQRVVSIPPMASISLNPIDFYGLILKSHNRNQVYSNLLLKYVPFFVSLGILKDKGDYYKINWGEMKRGQIVDIPRIPGNEISIHITYSFDENLSSTQSIRTNFYVSQIIGREYYREDMDKIRIPLLNMDPLRFGNHIMKR